jgi:hypothetical protein
MREETQTTEDKPYFNKSVFIDAAIVLGLTFVGGFAIGFVGAVVGMSAQAQNNFMIISNAGGVILGSFIAALRTKSGSLVRHLQAVGTLVWLFNLVNVAFGIISFLQFLFSAIITALLVALGGWLSTLLSGRRA